MRTYPFGEEIFKFTLYIIEFSLGFLEFILEIYEFVLNILEFGLEIIELTLNILEFSLMCPSKCLRSVWLMSALQATYYIIYHNPRLWDRVSDWLIFIFQIKFSGGKLIYNLAQKSGGREENALEKCPILSYHASN